MFHLAKYFEQLKPEVELASFSFHVMESKQCPLSMCLWKWDKWDKGTWAVLSKKGLKNAENEDGLSENQQVTFTLFTRSM